VIRALVRRGVGFALLTQGAFEVDLRQRQVEAVPFRPRAYWPLALIAPANAPRSEVVAGFVRTLRAVTRELVASGTWPGKSLDRG
jgi:DNA-binding transcriptional LysR family regulator